MGHCSGDLRPTVGPLKPLGPLLGATEALRCATTGTRNPSDTGRRGFYLRGAKGTRTPDPHTASVVRYQLRHSPVLKLPGTHENLLRRARRKLHHFQEGQQICWSNGWPVGCLFTGQPPEYQLICDTHSGLPRASTSSPFTKTVGVPWLPVAASACIDVCAA